MKKYLLLIGVCWSLLPAGECDNPASAWLFCEDCEFGEGDWNSWYGNSEFFGGPGSNDRGRVTLSSAQHHSGSWAIYMPAASASGYQGGTLDWRACTGAHESNCALNSYDKLYYRVWIRFASDHRYVHHFMNISGSQPDDYWYHGTAGCMPNGELHMGTTVDHKKDFHNSFFYTYYPGMNCDPNCDNYNDVDANCADCAAKGLPTCTDQKQCCWGANLMPDPVFSFPVGEWFCFEMMMQANTVGSNDGYMAYWVNDSLIDSVGGMMWRTTPLLALNRVRLQHYITTKDAGGFSNRVWFDDIVVSTDRIGAGTIRVKNQPEKFRASQPIIKISRISPNEIGMKLLGSTADLSRIEIYTLSGKKVWTHKVNPEAGYKNISLKRKGSVPHLFIIAGWDSENTRTQQLVYAGQN